MAPAFSSAKQTGAFALLLLALLLLPAIFSPSLLPPRSEVYASLNWRYCASEFLHRQIFNEKSDIDIAFIGSSRMWAGIETPYVQKQLSERLGRDAVVLTLAWSWLGFDANYFITQDLLQHRKVRMIVFDDEFRADEEPHVAATHWFRFGDNAPALAGLPLRNRMSYYFAAILGMPRNLLSLVRSNIPETVPSLDNIQWTGFYHAPNPRDLKGALTVERWLDSSHPFADFNPAGGVQPADVQVYSPETAGQFHFAGLPTTPWQLQFAKKFAALARDNDVRLVFLHLTPVYASNETTNPFIEERERWPDVLNAPVVMMGIPPARLYSGIQMEDLPKLFYTPDLCHYNKNGQDYFTRAITPKLLEIYESGPPH